jgi:AmmeMemoRadiSam system protein B
VEELKRLDSTLIDAVASGDAEKLYSEVAADKDARNVCGLPPIYTALAAARPATGRMTAYDQAPDPAGGVASFATFPFESLFPVA